jgi:hypothetical protein
MEGKATVQVMHASAAIHISAVLQILLLLLLLLLRIGTHTRGLVCATRSNTTQLSSAQLPPPWPRSKILNPSLSRSSGSSSTRLV